jgi:uncharacterized SAM-binding protein YcdF (DUF218 family)
MKLFVGLVAIAISAALVIVGISTYLAPDGLSHCKEQPSQDPDCSRVDAVVAISGGDTSARTAGAIELYKNGWADVLVFSGAAQDKSGPSNAEAMKRQALQSGIPESQILIDETSETTKQNAANTNDLFEQNNISSVILVTSAYHQRRAGLEFGERAGGKIKIVNHPVSQDNQWSSWWWTTPTGWFLATSELVKIVAFYAGGSR